MISTYHNFVCSCCWNTLIACTLSILPSNTVLPYSRTYSWCSISPRIWSSITSSGRRTITWLTSSILTCSWSWRIASRRTIPCWRLAVASNRLGWVAAWLRTTKAWCTSIGWLSWPERQDNTEVALELFFLVLSLSTANFEDETDILTDSYI